MASIREKMALKFQETMASKKTVLEERAKEVESQEVLGNLFEDENFEEYNSEDEDRVDAHMDQLEQQVIKPLTTEKI